MPPIAYNPPVFEFQIKAQNARARAGVFTTPHGDLLTPVFAPVGTQATVKTLTPAQVEAVGASLVLSNTYHLYLRPGDELVRDMGGLHEFMQWPHPMLTDSGGFQVFSLAKTRKIDDDGVTFKSHIDGSTHRFTPEKSIAIQENLGADIIMAFDECSDPNDHAYTRACHAPHAPLGRALPAGQDPLRSGSVRHHPGRRRSGAPRASPPASSPRSIRPASPSAASRWGRPRPRCTPCWMSIEPHLPVNKPRYLMGVGTPEDLIDGIARGVDIFDCVLPTRLARHHAAFSPEGRLNLMNAAFARDHGSHRCRPVIAIPAGPSPAPTSAI